MPCAWPFEPADPMLDEALEIALDYLEATGQAEIDDESAEVAAAAILSEWLHGSRHRIRLANEGIVAVQQFRAASPKRAENMGLDAAQN
jgi:hypothetical protein